MAIGQRVEGDSVVNGNVIANGVSLKNASIRNVDIVAAAGIDASKLEHQHAITYRQKTGSVIVSATEDVHLVHGVTGDIIAVEVVATTAPTGGDKLFTVDVQKGSTGVAFATVLTGVVSYSASQASKDVVDGVLVASPTLAAGDILRVVVAASGSTGTQGQGLLVLITTREDAD